MSGKDSFAVKPHKKLSHILINMIYPELESSAIRVSPPPRPDYLRMVFEKDSSGRIVRTEDGKRTIVAVEHVAAREVISTVQIKPADPEPQVEEATVEPEYESSISPTTEITLLES